MHSSVFRGHGSRGPCGCRLRWSSETVVFVSPDLTEDDDKELVFERGPPPGLGVAVRLLFAPGGPK